MRYIGWLIAGFVLYKLSGVLETMGDTAPYAAEGVSGERLQYHGAALAALLAGFACFVWAGVQAWRAIRGGGKSAPKASKAVTVEEPEPFDADAALARYLDRVGDRPPAPPGSFGRKGR